MVISPGACPIPTSCASRTSPAAQELDAYVHPETGQTLAEIATRLTAKDHPVDPGLQS
jgi:hypothetical protein